MKGGLRIVTVCIFVFAIASEADAAWPWQKKAGGAKDEAVQQKSEQKSAEQKSLPSGAPSIDEAARKAKRELVEKKRQGLNGFAWDIEMTPMSGKAKKLEETVIFSGGKVSFRNFSPKGFEATNFSLKLQEDNTLVWETMQTSEKSGVLFWRGEISPDGQVMRGVASHQINEQTKDGYTFISLGKKNSEEAVGTPQAKAK